MDFNPDFPLSDDGSGNRKIMDLIAEGTKNSVETIHFRSERALRGTFDKFGRKHATSISSVQIYLQNGPYACLEPFGKLSSQQEFQCGIKAPADLMKRFTNRGVICLDPEGTPYYGHDYGS